MKNFFLLILLIAVNSNVRAQNKLTIFSEIGEQFYVILNGVRQNVNPETNVKVEGLTADYYSAKIIFNNANITDIDKKYLNVTGTDCTPCAVTYKIKYNKKGEITMKMFNFTPIAQDPPSPNLTVVNYNTVPMPTPVVGVQITETTTTHHQSSNGDNVNVGMNIGGFNMGVNVNVNDGFGSSSQTSTTTTTTTTVVPTQQVVPVEEICSPMSASNFNSLMSTLNDKSWDEERMDIAKQASNSNCFTAKQIKQIMSTFEWEDAKLEFAKHAYVNCYDQNNYYQVNDEFEWSDNVKKLNQYIGQ